MLGAHPQLYGFPELNLFTADTVGGLTRFQRDELPKLGLRSQPLPPGLLRAVAELMFGGQTAQAVERAADFLGSDPGRATADVLRELLEKIGPRIGVDKSPLTGMTPENLRRAGAHPGGRFLHLVRHPTATQRSMQEHFARPMGVLFPAGERRSFTQFCADMWLCWQRFALDFLGSLPADRFRRARAEDLLGDPDRHWPPLAQWLGVRTDGEALDAMKHPERSPYAGFGPAGAVGGGDAKFFRDPKLRPAAIPESPDPPAEWGLPPWVEADIRDVARRLGYG